MSAETVVVVMVLLVAAGVAIYFVSQQGTKSPSSSLGGGLDALCGTVAASKGVPPSACAALAPFANSLVDSGTKYVKANVDDALSVGRTGVSAATDYSKKAIGTAKRFAEQPLNQANRVLNLAEGAGSKAKKIAGSVYDEVSSWF